MSGFFARTARLLTPNACVQKAGANAPKFCSGFSHNEGKFGYLPTSKQRAARVLCSVVWQNLKVRAMPVLLLSILLAACVMICLAGLIFWHLEKLRFWSFKSLLERMLLREFQKLKNQLPSHLLDDPGSK